VEYRISGLEGRKDIKEKTKEVLDKRLKSWERNTQELHDSIRRPNLWIVGIEEGEEMQARDT
jgi:hypothetical protein